MISEELKKLREKVALLIEKAKNSNPKGDWVEYITTFWISPYAETGDTLEVVIPKYCTSLNKSFSGVSNARPKYKTLIISKPDEAEYPITSLREMFYYNTTTSELYLNINTSKVKDVDVMMNYYCYIENIYGEIDCSSINHANIVGLNGERLVTITFKAETIKSSITFNRTSKLSDESIQSIIDGLAQTDEARTLTFHNSIKNKLTEEQIANINEKGWTLA